ncbi:MAG: hypothetical protein KDE27_14460 [Planctomycetes bacterium]|nr:hypothetical protein [Planctomycetota bacterium]
MTPSSRLTTLALPLAFAALSLATVRSQTDWIERKPAHAPPARSYHAMACDSLRGRIVLFGGQVSQGNPLGDTWEWDGVDWQQATPLTSPPAQSRHALAFDAARGVVVLVGTNGDMWEFDGTTWNAAPPCPGSPLYTDVGVLMAYDASRSRLCVVGSNGSPVHEYDGAAWSTITPATTAPPSPGYTLSNMIFHTAIGRVVTFLPFDVISYNPYVAVGPEMWQWDGADWQSGFAMGPAYIVGHRLSDASALGASLLYGGSCCGGVTNPTTSALWPANTTATTRKHPLGRVAHGMCDDPVRGRVVLFGGLRIDHLGNGTLANDTFEFVGRPLSAATETWGAGCGAPALGLDSASGSRPVLGTTFQADVSGVAPGFAGCAVGFNDDYVAGSPFQVPWDLALYGMPGCSLWTSADIPNHPVQVAGSQATVTIALPLASWLIGQQMYLQAFAVQPGANPTGIAFSNGLQLTLGDQ